MLSRSIISPLRQVSFRSLSVSVAVRKEVPEVYDPTQIPKEIVSGAPKEMATERVVRIYKEAKSATQQGRHNRDHWKLDWDVLGKGNRWENDLIGYQSSSDYMQGTIMSFDTKEAAINFAKGQGWDHYVQEPKERHFRQKQYATNFLHSAGPLKHIRTK
ncbi:uncharacterized protein PRCAT00001697001 [Priceomyces carsonii]|uniref:uncharacterized protein n=1 Tax=Priceomyces carsonii TaxID=28549 RepID=UPI002EDAFAFE|nr:unnamed protein product [Priceomyces carsonii]